MGRPIQFIAANAASLLFIFAGLMLIYVLARVFKASPLAALCFALLPIGVGYLLQHPSTTTQLMAMLP